MDCGAELRAPRDGDSFRASIVSKRQGRYIRPGPQAGQEYSRDRGRWVATQDREDSQVGAVGLDEGRETQVAKLASPGLRLRERLRFEIDSPGHPILATRAERSENIEAPRSHPEHPVGRSGAWAILPKRRTHRDGGAEVSRIRPHAGIGHLERLRLTSEAATRIVKLTARIISGWAAHEFWHMVRR